MKLQIITLALAIFASARIAAAAQIVDQLLADHSLLDAELDRCKRLGMAEIGDARCKVAHETEHKRFFGNGQMPYSESPPQVFQHTPHIDPQPMKQKAPAKPDAPSNG